MNVYKMRKAGKEYCNTEGSEHYKFGGIEPLDLIASKGMMQGFALGNIIKYASGFPVTGNLQDLKKIADYAQILVGYKLAPKDITAVFPEILPEEPCKDCDDKPKYYKNCEWCMYYGNHNVCKNCINGSKWDNWCADCAYTDEDDCKFRTAATNDCAGKSKWKPSDKYRAEIEKQKGEK